MADRVRDICRYNFRNRILPKFKYHDSVMYICYIGLCVPLNLSFKVQVYQLYSYVLLQSAWCACRNDPRGDFD